MRRAFEGPLVTKERSVFLMGPGEAVLEEGCLWDGLGGRCTGVHKAHAIRRPVNERVF
jgi:hypothetical protein